jgi:hypothetical protein
MKFMKIGFQHGVTIRMMVETSIKPSGFMRQDDSYIDALA